MIKNKFLGLIGMAAKAGKLTYGSSLVRAKIQGRQKPNLVILSSDSSDNTKKRIINCCTYYSCKIMVAEEDSDTLGHITGREGPISCIAVNDEGFSTAIEKATKGTSSEDGQNS
ncbi:MAG: 50S ribosomal protein L7ae [Ruminococcaceae bacterium]|nr:50S ribosomal protein L7ae [Oscillospiraceae bacterium]